MHFPAPQRLWCRTVKALLFTLLLALTLGPQRPLVLCTADCCVSRAPVAEAHCCCCEHGEPSDPAEGDGRNQARCKSGCCVDVCTHLETGPLPRPTDEPPALALCPGIEPWPVLGFDSGALTAVVPHNHGPPRTDQRTALRASTVLRL